MSGERIRSLKPEWLDDQKIASASDTARLLSIALILLSDDHGRGRAHAMFLASRVWPYSSREPRETLATLSGGLQELCNIGFLRLYQVEGQDYFEIVNWKKHQRVDKPSKPRVPEPLANVSGDPRESLAPDLDLRSGSPTADRASERAVSVDPARRVSPHCVWLAWNSAARDAGHTVLFGEQAEATWWEEIAAACNTKNKPQRALDLLCAWLWAAPDGPVKRSHNPIPPALMRPKTFAAGVNEDLRRSREWAQSSALEAAQ